MFKNYKILIMLCLIFTIVIKTSAAYADNNAYSAITKDEKVIQVLDSLNKTDLDKKTKDIIMGENRSNKPIKILFANISEVSMEHSNDEALACKDRSDNLYILISNEHKDAPVEALMAILTHEVIHQDDSSSKAEELQGWMNEVYEWAALKKVNPDLNEIAEHTCPLVDRLNTLEKMYIGAGYSPKYIYQEINSNPVYTNLSLYSPGFTSLPADTLIANDTDDKNLYISHNN